MENRSRLPIGLRFQSGIEKLLGLDEGQVIISESALSQIRT